MNLSSMREAMRILDVVKRNLKITISGGPDGRPKRVQKGSALFSLEGFSTYNPRIKE